MKIVLAAILALVLTIVRAIEYLEVHRPTDRAYSLESEICCNGTIFDDKNSNDYECCGGKLIDKKTEICCFPDYYPLEPHTKCCGNKVFNSLTHFCHDWITVRRTKTSSDSSGYPVILPIGTDLESTCRDKVIDLDVEICCSYKIIPDPDHKLQCCGTLGHAYDPSTQVCCRNSTFTSIIPKINPRDDYCCNEKPYNYFKSICRNGEIVDITDDEIRDCGRREIYNVTSEVCCPFFSNVTKKLEPDHNACCIDVSYNTQESTCCQNYIVNKVYTNLEAENKRCCGKKLLDENQECCASRHPYDPSTQTCCVLWKDIWNRVVGKVHEGSGRECCGLNVVDDDTEECCGTTIIPKSAIGQSSCCPHTTTDLDNEEFVGARDTRYHGDDDFIIY